MQNNKKKVKVVNHRCVTAHDFLQREMEKMNMHVNREHLVRKYAPQIFRAVEETTEYYGA